MKKIFMIGNAHIDPIWLWRWQEGFAEIKATFRSALDRMNEFPDFIFTSACASYYQWIEENEPEMFEEIKRRVAEGRWVLVGGWWLQPDCNIPSGESFARHALYSQRYFKAKLGITAKVGYNVDSFGHNGMLPQLLKKSGMDYYVFMRPDVRENSEVPGNLFWWESEDGSRVLAYKIPTGYGSFWGDGDKGEREMQKINETIGLSEKNGYDYMNFYGVGNHGGGPTISNLHFIHNLQEKLGKDNLFMSSPNEYFEYVSKKNYELPVFKDDLQHHASGCYSTHSETKASNRRAEHRLLSAEKFMTIAHVLKGLSYPKDRVQWAWQKVMFNQFHDIMGGCSIKEAYQDVRESYGEALNISAELLNASVQKLSWSIDTMGEFEKKRSKEKDWYLWETDDLGAPLVVFNSLSWEVEAPIQVNKMLQGITDNDGNTVEIQKVRGPQSNGADKWNTLFTGKIPAMGYRVYWMYKDKELKAPEGVDGVTASQNAKETVLENRYLRIEFEPYSGAVKRMYDKVNKVEVLSGKGAVPVVIDNHDSDTWAHGIFKFKNEIGRFHDAEIKVIEEGPVRVKVRVTSKYNQSTMRQDFTMYRDKADIEVNTKLDWHEKHKMLKLSFPVNVDAPKATYEIPYGYIERPVNGEEEPGQKWIDVSGNTKGDANTTYGLAIINDSKYSFEISDNDMRMTVVNGAIFADHYAYHSGERDELCEYMDQGIQEFNYVILPHIGDWSASPVVKRSNELNEKPVWVMETYHKGELPRSFEGIKIAVDNVIATVLKKAEDKNGYILRCYETCGKEAVTEIEIPFLNKKWSAKFGKCEIKTFYIPEASEELVIENNLIEE